MADYRYPGLRPFEDTDLDRSLFFGRDREKEEALHLILAEKLTVVFAKSGTGKSSLLNAGILQPLRERDFLPIKVRFNDSRFTPIETIYQAISSAIMQQQIEEPTAEHGALADYFQVAEFWSSRDTLLTPVLVLDQFEEFFETYDSEARAELIAPLAECLKNRQVSVKIVIALREDYLAQLEELASEMPEIFSHRFRLTALRREQAQAAIECPANDFSYAPETIAAILDFLCTRKERQKTIITDEVEPFQLQLLCQHIETKIRQQQKHIVQTHDLGGETGMQRVLQNFYDRQLKQVRSRRKRNRVRKLCEKGLVSATNRRLSVEEEDIQRRFNVPKPLLEALVDRRLLRADARVGGVYYELSHDTMVLPVRKSQRTHKIKTRIVGGVLAALLSCGICGMLVISYLILQYTSYTSYSYGMVKIIRTALIWPEKFFSFGYGVIGRVFFQNGNNDEAIIQCRKAIELNPDNAYPYAVLGSISQEQGKYDDAIMQYRKALELQSKYHGFFNAGYAYMELGRVFETQGKYDEAIVQYRKALDEHPNDDSIYYDLSRAFALWGKDDEANAFYHKALALHPHKRRAAETALIVGDYDDALWFSKEVLKYKRIKSDYKFAMQFNIVATLFFQKKRSEAAIELDTLFDEYDALTEDYPRNWIYNSKEVIKNSDKLRESDKRLLLALIDILESPKADGKKKLQELKAQFPELE